jgi:hypothetical protein
MTNFESAARADDLNDMLEHIAWTDTVKPELLKLRDLYASFLSKSVLGTKITDGTNIITSEQLAARVEGIDFITALFEKVLRRGKKALEELRSQGLGPVN